MWLVRARPIPSSQPLARSWAGARSCFAIGGQPVVLLYGSVTPWRAFAPGMTPGEDVAQLNANLDALGYGHGLSGGQFHRGNRSGSAAAPSGRGPFAERPAPGGLCRFPAGCRFGSRA